MGKFINEFARHSLLRKKGLSGRRAATLLRDLAPLFRTQADTIDLSGLLDVIVSLLDRQELRRDPLFRVSFQPSVLVDVVFADTSCLCIDFGPHGVRHTVLGALCVRR